MRPIPLTIEQIKQFLKEQQVGNNGVLPFCKFVCIVKNPMYDPDNFSQEIEDSEVEINWFKEMKTKMDEPGFDIVWNNTLGSIPKNSQRWCDNHSKKCELTMIMTDFCQSLEHRDGTRDYCNESVINIFQKLIDAYGEIYEIR